MCDMYMLAIFKNDRHSNTMMANITVLKCPFSKMKDTKIVVTKEDSKTKIAKSQCAQRKHLYHTQVPQCILSNLITSQHTSSM